MLNRVGHTPTYKTTRLANFTAGFSNNCEITESGTGESVSTIILTRLGPSLTVLIPLTILETLIAVALALAIAFVRGSITDRIVMIACTVGMSISILVYIILFQYWFAYKLSIFPVQGWGNSFSENLFH